MAVLPNFAAPLSTVEQVLELDDQSIRAARTLAQDEPYFAGHFANYPIFPGVFILEAVHQATCHYAVHRFASSKQIRLAQVRSIRFLSPLRPGDRFEVVCHYVLSPNRDELQVEAECRREENETVAKVKLRYALTDSQVCQEIRLSHVRSQL